MSATGRLPSTAALTAQTRNANAANSSQALPDNLDSVIVSSSNDHTATLKIAKEYERLAVRPAKREQEDADKTGGSGVQEFVTAALRSLAIIGESGWFFCRQVRSSFASTLPEVPRPPIGAAHSRRALVFLLCEVRDDPN